MIQMIFVALLSLNLWAGDRAGNGGDVIVCKDKVEMLDSYEARLRGHRIDIKGATLESKVEFLLKRVEEIDPANAILISTNAKTLLYDILDFEKTGKKLQRSTLFTDDNLVDIKDSFETTIPRNCTIEQLIIYKSRPLFKDRYFTISVFHWKKLSTDEKAMAVMHEALYAFFYKRGWSDSRLARNLNGIIASETFKDYSIRDYLQDVQKSSPIQHSFHYLVQPQSPSPFHDTPYEVPLANWNFSCREHLASPSHLQSIQGPADEIFCLNLSLPPVSFFPHSHADLLIPYRAVLSGKRVIQYEAILGHTFNDKLLSATDFLFIDGDNQLRFIRWPQHSAEEVFTKLNKDVSNLSEIPRVLFSSDKKASTYLLYQNNLSVIKEWK